MTNLKKYFLDYKKTYPYFIDHVEWGTALSKKIVEKINFQEGFFFTYLPDCANLEKLYDFIHAGMLPQENTPIKLPKFPDSIFFPVSNLNQEISEYTFEFLELNKKRMVFLEFYNASPKSKYLNWEDENLLLMKEEVYYILKRGASLNSIKSAISESKTIRHSIMMFVNNIETLPRSLREEDFDLLCDNTFQIATTAYDGEGFVFWERTEKQK